MAIDQQLAVAERSPLREWSRDWGLTAALLVVAAVGWWWSSQAMDHEVTADDGMAGMAGMADHATAVGMSFGAFTVAWLAMMAAMMLPAVAPVVGLYRRAVAAGRAAPLPIFLSGYLLVWTVPGIPAYWAWRELEGPLADGRAWAGRLAAAALLAAALWQVGPVKAMCLRHCRSPLSFFMRHKGGLRRPAAAIKLGVAHGGFCLGCCWLLMVVLVALGTMNLYWMAGLAIIIFAEKVVTEGEWFSRATAIVMAALGLYLLVDPAFVGSIT